MTGFKKWAQTRNFAKLRLRGVLATLDNLSKDPLLAGPEQWNLVQALEFVASVIANWNAFTPESKAAYALRAVEHDRRWLVGLPRIERESTE